LEPGFEIGYLDRTPQARRRPAVIESYEFGRIVIKGKRYATDVIIYPDHVEDNWWREEGHSLSLVDLWAVVQAKPEVLVIGTGYSGLMRVLPETEKYLREQGIRLIAERTTEAVRIYNQLCQSTRVVAALHLTC
jgi:hypothetical protein